MKLVLNLIILFGGLAVLVGLLLWMQGSFTPDRIEPALLPEAKAEAADVPTVTAAYRTMDQTAEAVGSIQSRSTTNVASKILATILSINVRPGDTVKKGDLLITLDDRDLCARMQQSRNALEAAKATYDKAVRDRQRYEALLKTQSVTQNAYDEMVSAERIAQARLEQAQEQVNEAEVMLSYARIYAPVDGTVIEKFADPGDLASPGKPLLTMYDPTNLRVEAAVREQLSGRLKIGQKLKVRIDAVNKEMEGTVNEIVPSADPASRSVIVKVEIPRETGIFPGMFGRIEIPLDPVKYLVIPRAAIRTVGQLEFITVKKDNQMETRAVRTGRRWNGDIEILSGLTEGEHVVIRQEPAA
ncbi:MAG TPA: efflux RND transporter periplasmic adaptor subunit [bacterium]|nr:efflux RND transporter periplasmic adaptor subunit [bacterium]HOL92742.1 efflux RND transporter periplasmic adaptor subunit [bacterium]HPO99043.1 efflux RND transporter periplasmic adaptor subunit [bacterium]HXK93705.1 efflux RND transporter periplasmic adaptor subunit [bacterium]